MPPAPKQWVPFYSALAKKRSLSRETRFVFLEVCLEVMTGEGSVEVAPHGDLVDAVAGLVGGDRAQVVTAVPRLFDPTDPMLSVRQDGGRRWVSVVSWDRWRPGRSSAARTREWRAKQSETAVNDVVTSQHPSQVTSHVTQNVTGISSSYSSDLSLEIAQTRARDAEQPPHARIGAPFTAESDARLVASVALMPADAGAVLAFVTAIRSATWCYPSASLDVAARVAAGMAATLRASVEATKGGSATSDVAAAVVAFAIAERGKYPAMSDAALVAKFPTFLSWELKNIAAQNRREIARPPSQSSRFAPPVHDDKAFRANAVAEMTDTPDELRRKAKAADDAQAAAAARARQRTGSAVSGASLFAPTLALVAPPARDRSLDRPDARPGIRSASGEADSGPRPTGTRGAQ